MDADWPAAMDFEGTYGLDYAAIIRRSIPAYEALLEIGAAALAATVPDAATALVVGPGRGEELPGLLDALPQARFWLVEPSAAMAAACDQRLTAAGAGGRCRLVPQRLQDWDEGQGHRFDAVVALNVLHLFPSEEQARLLRQLAVRVAPGGTLLLGGYSEDPDPDEFALLLSVAQERLKRLGCDAATVERLLASRGTAVVGMRGPQLTQELTAAGLEPPQILLQALATRLWLSRRPA